MWSTRSLGGPCGRPTSAVVGHTIGSAKLIGARPRPCAQLRSLSRPTATPETPPHPQQRLHPRCLPIHPEINAVIYSEDVIEARVAEMGRLIGQDYQHTELLVLGVLKGAFMFTTDLVRHIYPYPASLEVDFFKASSYGSGTTSSGVVQLDSAFKLESVAGKHVLLVEDIIDSGNTFSRLVAVMREAGAATVRVAALLDKKARRRVPFEADYTGFECPDEFIVGYGIDYAEKYRNLPYIGSVREEFIRH
ncbi:hypothetical protein PLESTB_001626600 [Pleodorina starrii]|uniref:Hypoxanthine phosphoribosyltransferase n=1 Tax=Pleodorina starrii TaxID=330485 RepID=A0A9W6BYD6_9CHLO|nr:hypothetical protein PLESTM_000912200 [Pleodorina starrii]GLC60557.1 hypothetical protein PLESTB_001626600 [Pleodorina starrii]GLC77137.1 hypothetical protein PLESTF_001890300 [Pleodorina starrii]